jgi:hypothetical protein
VVRDLISSEPCNISVGTFCSFAATAARTGFVASTDGSVYCGGRRVEEWGAKRRGIEEDM